MGVPRPWKSSRTAALKVRPIHHRLAERVKAHVFLLKELRYNNIQQLYCQEPSKKSKPGAWPSRVKSISVRGLTDEQVEALKKLVDLFREQKKRQDRESEKIAFASWPLGAKGKLAREETCDYL